MPTDREKLDYLNEIVRTRGYAHGSHRLLANHDLDVLKAVNDITLANYIPQRSLSAADKELVLVGAFTALRSQPAIIRAHIQKAAKAGAGLRQSLAAIELTLLEAGRNALDAGLTAWQEVAAADSSVAPARDAAARNANRSDSEGTMSGNTSGAILDRHDPEVGRAVARLSEAIDHEARGLDDRTREIVKTAVLVCVRASDERLEAQMRRALAAGASARDLLEAIEVIITPAGLPVFDAGLAIWARVTGAKPLEPEIDAPHSRGPRG